jgi:hypothetical protein
MMVSPLKYFDELISIFPELKESLWDWNKDNNMTHSNMERFAEFTFEQIKSENWIKLKECFSFQEDRITHLSPELENALNVSYCEYLLCSGTKVDMKNVISYMGPLLKKVYQDYEKYFKIHLNF